jgi:hypothetical protein
LLKNIGVSRDKMTDDELMAIFNELGRDDDNDGGMDSESGTNKLIWVEDVETMLLSSSSSSKSKGN